MTKLNLSVVIPTHNRATLLKQCLESLQQQTIPSDHFEVIVIDDASTDETPQMIEQLNLPPSYRYVQQPHGGASAARNRGAGLAQGEIILFFDDDVVATPGLLAGHLDAHKQWGRGSILGYTPFAADLPNTSIMAYHRDRWDGIFSDAMRHDMEHNELPYYHFITLNLSVRRQDFETIGPFNDDLGVVFEDTELGLRFFRAGISLHFCKAAQAWHRPKLDATSLTQRQENYGFRAGQYYLHHPDDEAMNASINVDYVLNGTREGAKLSLRQQLRHQFDQPWLNAGLLFVVRYFGQQLPANLRNYMCNKIKWYHYSQGFKRALAESKQR